MTGEATESLAELRELAKMTAAALKAARATPHTLPMYRKRERTETYGFLGRRTRVVAVDEVEDVAVGWSLWEQAQASYVMQSAPGSPVIVNGTYLDIWLTPEGELVAVEREHRIAGSLEITKGTCRLAAPWELEYPDHGWIVEDIPAQNPYLEKREWRSDWLRRPQLQPYGQLRRALSGLRSAFFSGADQPSE